MATYDTSGFVGIHQVQNYQPTQPIFTAESVASAIVYPAEDGEGDLFGCNLSFDLFNNIGLNLPGADFFSLYAMPNLSLFAKADQFSYEVASINDILIRTIEDMGCCDIARKYNTTMVPFFRYFADNPDINDCGVTGQPGDSCSWATGDNFMSALIEVVKVITTVQSVVEPLMCLIRPLPGNPWLPYDIDFLQWAYSYSRKSGPYVDRIMSGEVLDIMLNPVSNLRRKLQMCSTGMDIPTFFDLKAVGDFNQLQRILAVAAREGNAVSASNIPEPIKPREPVGEWYSSNAAFVEAQSSYTVKLGKYNQDMLTWRKIQREIEDSQRPRSALSDFQTDAILTKQALGGSNSNLCNCVIEALGMENLMPDFMDIHSSLDISSLIGKELNITYQEANVTDRIHERTDKIIFERKHIDNDAQLHRILALAEKSRRYTDIDVNQTTETYDHPYKDTIKEHFDNIQVPAISIERTAHTGNGSQIYKVNEKILQKIKELRLSKQKIQFQIAEAESKTKEDFDKKSSLSKKALEESFGKIASNYYGENTSEYAVSHDLAQSIHSSYFASWSSFDLNRDAADWGARSSYMDPNDMDYPVQGITPYTPVEDQGDIATEASVDTRTETVYFNNGLTFRAGDINWRCNNPLGLSSGGFTDTLGAVSYYTVEDDFIAVFPNINTGITAGIEWIYATYANNTIREFIVSIESDPILADILSKKIARALGHSDSLILDSLIESSRIELVRQIAYFYGFEVGEVWYQGARQPVSAFLDPVVSSQEEITQEALDNLPVFIQNQVNNQLNNRGQYYSDIFLSSEQLRLIDEAIEDLQQVLESNISARILYFKPIAIPCTCDNFVCGLLQMIINYILSLFNELMMYLADLILKYLIPDFIRNLIKLVMEKVQCLVALFNIGETLNIIDDSAKMLLEDLRHRISLYPDDTCFVPPAAGGGFDDDGPDEPNNPNDPGNPWREDEDNPWEDDSGSTGWDPYDPRTTVERPNPDEPWVIIINDPDSDDTISTDTEPPNFIPPGQDGVKLPQNGLAVKLIMTNGVQPLGRSTEKANIPILKFDCESENIKDRYTACNQLLDDDVLIIP